MKLRDLLPPSAAGSVPLSINVGNRPNDRTGEGLRTAFSKTMGAVNALANVEFPETPLTGIDDVPGLPPALAAKLSKATAEEAQAGVSDLVGLTPKTGRDQLNALFLPTLAALGSLWNPMAYGAVGDGVSRPLSTKFSTLAAAQVVYPHAQALTDELDWAALQLALRRCSARGGQMFLATPPVAYIINRPLTAAITDDNLADLAPGESIHNGDMNRMSVFANGALIRATAAMPHMFKFTYTNGNTTPYYCEVKGLKLDCNGLAENGLDLDWGMHHDVSLNNIFGFTGSGIVIRGRGVHRIRTNTIIGPVCITIGHADTLSTTNYGGGDSIVEGNDLYPSLIGVDCRMWSGNTSIYTNTATRADFATGPVYFVRLSGDASVDGARQVNDIQVFANEARGFDALLYGRRSAAVRNIYNVGLDHNHTNADGSNNAGVLADVVGVDDLHIGVNWINAERLSVATAAEAIKAVDCRRLVIGAVHANRLNGRFATITDCPNPALDGFILSDVGMALGAGGEAIMLNGSTTRALVRPANVRQSNASYAQTLVRESGTANDNVVFRGQVTGMSALTVLTGATSRSNGERKTWAPTVTFATPGDFSPTYALQEGEYWRDGDYVHVRFRVTFTANAYTSATGAFRLILPVGYFGAGMGVPLSRVFNVDIPAGTFGEPKGYVASAGGPTFLEFLINRPANAPIFLGSNLVPPSRASVSIEGQFFYRAA